MYRPSARPALWERCLTIVLQTQRTDAMKRHSPADQSSLELLEPRRLCSAGPGIAISDVGLAEGQGGQTAYVFTVSLSKASSKRVAVNFATENGSALAGADYVQT